MDEDYTFTENNIIDQNNINGIPYEQYFLQDNNQNPYILYPTSQQSPIIYKEAQKNYIQQNDFQNPIINNEYNKIYDPNFNTNYTDPLITSLLNNENQINYYPNDFTNKYTNILDPKIPFNQKNQDLNINYNNYYNLNQNNQIILQLFPKMNSSFVDNYKKTSIKIIDNKNKSNFLLPNIPKNFDPYFWKNFYDENDPFFTNKEDRSNIIETTITSNDPDDPNIIETYTGEINNNNEKHGFGKLVSQKKTRIGNWRHNKFTGWGREILPSGEIYEGKFINGEINGKGIFKDKLNFYVGNFKKSIKNGKGELFNNDFHYVGNFKNDKIDGKGRIEIYGQGIYEGDFDNENINGYGVFKFLNGDYYEGDMKDGKMDGYGKLKCDNGNIYEGNFKDGNFHGGGTLSNKVGDTFRGNFIRGIPSEY